MNDGRRLRILRVENHADTHLSLTLLLEQCGHAVTGACTMQEAFDLLSLQEWDVLLSDIGLPDGSGWGPMGRAHPRREPYAIAMSGYGMNVDRGRRPGRGLPPSPREADGPRTAGGDPAARRAGRGRRRRSLKAARASRPTSARRSGGCTVRLRRSAGSPSSPGSCRVMSCRAVPCRTARRAPRPAQARPARADHARMRHVATSPPLAGSAGHACARAAAARRSIPSSTAPS